MSVVKVHGVKINLETANQIAKKIHGEEAFVKRLDLIYVAGIKSEDVSKYTYRTLDISLFQLLREMCLVRGVNPDCVHRALQEMGLAGSVDDEQPKAPHTTDPAELEFYERAVLAFLKGRTGEPYSAPLNVAMDANQTAGRLVELRREFIAQNKPS